MKRYTLIGTHRQPTGSIAPGSIGGHPATRIYVQLPRIAVDSRVRAWRVPGLPARLTRSQAGLSHDFATLSAKRRAPKFSAMLSDAGAAPASRGRLVCLVKEHHHFSAGFPRFHDAVRFVNLVEGDRKSVV